MSSGIKVKKLSAEYVNQVVDLHLKTWPMSELSMKLGRMFVTAFYSEVAKSPCAEGFLALVDNEVVAYVCAFSNYPEFNRKLTTRHFFTIGFSFVKAILFRRINISEALASFGDSRKYACLKEPGFHCGALAVSDVLRGKHGEVAGVMQTLFRESEDYFVSNGASYSWAAIDKDNLPSQLLFMSQGYIRKNEVKFGKRSIVIFEKALKQRA